MLPLFDEIHQEAGATNSLHVLAKGLGMHYAVAKLVASEVNKSSIILGLNISRQIATTLIWPTLHAVGDTVNSTKAPLLLPRFLSADYSVRDRQSVYNACGFIVVTPAVLVHDLLHEALPVEMVKGIVIFAADQVRERSNEHFALTLFRTKNRTAFVKAFSENAPALTRGFHAVEKLMRLMYLSRLSLWPRFHRSVRMCLKPHTPDLVDLAVPPSQRLSSLLVALRETVFAVLDDLRVVTRAIDYSDIYRDRPVNPNDTDAEYGNPVTRKQLVYNFDDIVRRQVEDAEGNSPRVRSLVADLTALRALLQEVFDYNPVHFYQRLVTLRHTATRGHSWLFRKEAQSVVYLARSRVWVVRKKKDSDAGDPANAERPDDEQVEVAVSNVENQVNTVPVAILEPPPKWRVLRDVLGEIKNDVTIAGPRADVGRVLIVVREERLVEELRRVLSDGGRSFLEEQFQLTFPSVARRSEQTRGPAQAGERKQQITLTQIGLPEGQRRPIAHQHQSEKEMRGVPWKRGRFKPSGSSEPDSQRHDDPDGKVRAELSEVFCEIKSQNSSKLDVLLWCMEWTDVQGRGHLVLNEYRPSFVVLYNADLAFVRQVEVYKASLPGRPVRLYLLTFENAVDYDRFRQSSEREKVAFKNLIRERATMTIHVNQEGREDEAQLEDSQLGAAVHSQRGLGDDRDSRRKVLSRKTPASRKILVDTRELRSSLPMLLHQSNFTIIPITLEVADFVLSNDIGIERKSIPDLVGSFASGRLFNQVEALIRHYKYPCLLIEMDASRPLSLASATGGVTPELFTNSLVSKMVMLLQQFPTLRLLWAQGAGDAAELFGQLKINEGEPNPEKAARLGVDAAEDDDRKFNAGPRALLRNLPGIDGQNIVSVMRKVKNVATLVRMSREEMTEILGNASKAALLHSFVNEEPSEALAAL